MQGRLLLLVGVAELVPRNVTVSFVRLTLSSVQ